MFPKPAVLRLVAGMLLLASLLLARQLAASGDPCPDISPLACTEVKRWPDQLFAFDGADGGLADRHGAGTGFTMVDPPSSPGNPTPDPSAPGFWPDKLTLAGGNLVITTTSGLAFQGLDSQDNALGIGLDLSVPASLRTTLVALPPAPGGFAQAGLWFGVSGIGPSGLGGTGTAEDDYVKLVAISDTPGTWEVQALREADGVAVGSSNDPIDGSLPLTLWLELNPSLRTITARYCNDAVCDPETSTVLLTFSDVPGEWFSTDQAGIDLRVGTRSMGGLFASHRQAMAVQTFAFADFAYTAGVSTLPFSSPDGVDFDTWRIEPVTKPTAMAWGPDDRLYVVDVTGIITALTIDHASRTVLDQQVIATVANRLALGLAIDPDSTPTDVILWVAHSDLNQLNGQANSGTVTRLTGPSFATRQDVITGLPRAIANHATNNIRFGPDGRLYIAQGGNTGAGAANDGGSEFGPRPEQPLSAALLVADVKAPGFDGSCTSQIDPDGAIMDATGVAARDVPCDVTVVASGLRNMYDFVFHSNGSIYGADNGLGVVGTFPDLPPSDLAWDPATGCEGMIIGSGAINAHFPGERADLVQRIVPGGYYGHPNPSRDECLFFGGNPTAAPDYPVPTTSAQMTVDYQDTDKYEVGRQPAPNWVPALFSLGLNKSANGVIEYRSNGAAFCGRLDGDLLFTYFSQADQIRRLTLGPGGLSVATDQALIRSTAETGGEGLSNPLPIAQDSVGRLYVGEFGTDKMTIFEPINVGLWTADGPASMPVALLDAGSAVIDGRLYAVAGKTNSGPQRTLYAYTADDNAWTQLADLPAAYPGVENPAVTAVNGRLYAFGGATAAFSGAVAKAAVYDPVAGTWAMLPDMPTARGGAAAAALGDDIYVIGGLDAGGDSVATVAIFNVTSGMWRAGDDLPSARDNAGAAVIDGAVLVFGGRLRAGGVEVESTLNTVTSYTPSGGWETRAPMPTGRRVMNVVVVDGEAIVIGGERAPDGSAFSATEGYDPVSDSWRLLTEMPAARHGAVAGVIDDLVDVAGGGPTGGTSFTDDVDVFHFTCLSGFETGTLLYLPGFLRD